MADKSQIHDFARSLVRNLSAVDGKMVGQDMQVSKTRLAKDNKGAMINDVVDKYLRKELSKEYLIQVKEEFGITISDVTREIARREMEKFLRT